jgi:hypothetical protein
MKYFITIFSFFLITLACTKSSDTSNKVNVSLIGKWKLTEYLIDPGNGSVTWKPAETDEYIEFTSDSTILNSSPTTGDIVRFSLPNDSTILFIYLTYNITHYYNIQGNELTITGGCIEHCGSKYIKQD